MMRVSYKYGIKGNRARAIAAGALLVLLLTLATVVVISADVTEPTWEPPRISKGASTSAMSLGDEVTFFIPVLNPEEWKPPYEKVVPWYQVEVLDVVTSVLRIDDVGITVFQGQPPLVDQVGNTVKVTVSRMDPGDEFVLQIVCTLIGPIEEGSLVRNTAEVTFYVDVDGRLGREYGSASTEVAVGYYPVWLPAVFRSYSP